jgi:hypothetical protein
MKGSAKVNSEIGRKARNPEREKRSRKREE